MKEKKSFYRNKKYRREKKNKMDIDEEISSCNKNKKLQEADIHFTMCVYC